jgi:hypothetical protein
MSSPGVFREKRSASCPTIIFKQDLYQSNPVPKLITREFHEQHKGYQIICEKLQTHNEDYHKKFLRPFFTRAYKYADVPEIAIDDVIKSYLKKHYKLDLIPDWQGEAVNFFSNSFPGIRPFIRQNLQLPSNWPTCNIL